MRNAAVFIGILVFALIAAMGFAADGDTPRWYAGQWDSCVYVLSDHPRTIALRVEVEDQDSGIALADAEIRLEGNWEQEQKFGNPITQQTKIITVTNARGIAVFALSWRKGSPNEKGYDLPMDDIEKVQRITARKRGYALASGPLSFDKLGEDPRQAWKRLIMDTPGARYFLLKPGGRFNGYGQRSSADPVFFEKIRDEVYGEVFPAKEDTGADFPDRFFQSNPPAESGPFMMLPVVIKMQRLFQEQRVETEGRRSNETTAVSRPESGMDHRDRQRAVENDQNRLETKPAMEPMQEPQRVEPSALRDKQDSQQAERMVTQPVELPDRSDYCDKKFFVVPNQSGNGVNGAADIVWQIPATVKPGEQFETTIEWRFTPDTPFPNGGTYGAGSVINVNVFGNWQPDDELTRLIAGDMLGTPRGLRKTFTIRAPNRPGTYALRWMFITWYHPNISFYGGRATPRDNCSPVAWTETKFKVSE